MQSAGKREVCYEVRDTYHKCLDQKGQSSEECLALNAEYEEKCPGSWRKYFNQQRERQAVLEMQAELSRSRTQD